MTTEGRAFDQIPGLLAPEHFSSETCFHLFLYPRAKDSSCSVVLALLLFFHFHVSATLYIYKHTLELLIDGAFYHLLVEN